ncbi:MAG: hypothetical protein KGN39_03265 [Betaproteobacteria bacterium]|nr:hypothetical protein [Betaproteobacteria bacterium]
MLHWILSFLVEPQVLLVLVGGGVLLYWSGRPEQQSSIRPENSEELHYPKVYRSPERLFQWFVVVPIGALLAYGGLYGVYYFLFVSRDVPIALMGLMVLFGPMILLGTWIAVSAMRWKVVLTEDSIRIDEGFSTHVIPRQDILSCEQKRSCIELIIRGRKSSLTLDKDDFDAVREFRAWLPPTANQSSATYRPFDTAMYPRIYSPSPLTTLLMGCLIPLALLTLCYLFVTSSRTQVWSVLLCPLLGYAAYLSIIASVRYQVVLMPDRVVVKTLLGTKQLLRDVITGYDYCVGRRPAVVLHARSQTMPKLSIPLNFELDEAFVRWITIYACLSATPLEIP